MKPALSVALLILVGTPASAHRLDEYLQGTLLSVEKDRVQAQMTLIPGVAVYPVLIAQFDTDADGVISETEQHAYAGQVLDDLSLAIDGRRLAPRLVSLQFPSVEEMKEGRGEIQLVFRAELPRGGRHRRLNFENRHQSGISAYQVNCLAPGDPDIRVAAQIRNFSQSLYRLDYVQTGFRSDLALLVALWLGGLGWLGLAACKTNMNLRAGVGGAEFTRSGK